MKAWRAYWRTIYEARWLLWHLIALELKNKFRRSRLGVLWTVLNPWLLSLLMSTVFGAAFHFHILEYMPYILSGILYWDIVVSAFFGGASALIGHEGFIRQCNYPLSMYTLKNACVIMVSFTIAMVSLVFWILLWQPENLLWGLLSFPLTWLIYFCLAWGGTTIAGYICVQYRDYPMMITLFLQAIWYVSPIFFDKSLFSMHPYLLKWFQINPITHMLNLLREPLLFVRMPSIEDYVSALFLTLVVGIFARYINHAKERDVIFYL